ncbi:MAG: trigger factor [Lachnospiraceae bacterium]|jgi:trigger factor|nr:trigger factor [Lachnospiraceae bacterium]
MKKKIVLILAAACALALAGGCGEKGSNKQEEAKTESPAPEEEPSGETEETGESTDKAGAGTVQYDASDYVELGEYKGLAITLGSYDVSEEDLKSNINALLQEYPDYEDTSKEIVEKGDTVNMDYEGIRDGVAFDGGTAQGAYLEIGSGNFIDGFEDGLVGKKVGEKVTLDLTFPENYKNQDLAGQAVVFHVTVNKIVKKKDMTYDKLTDKFVADNFAMQGYEDVEAFKAGIKEQIQSNNDYQKGVDIQSAIFEKLGENCTVKGFPDGLFEESLEEYLKQYGENLKASYGMEMDEYLESINSTEEDFNKRAEDYITDSLNNQLILEAIAKKENIGVDEEGFSEYKQGIVADYGYENEDALIEQHGKEYVERAYVTTKTLEMITENAKITYDKDAQSGAAGTGSQGEGDAAGDTQEDAAEK